MERPAGAEEVGSFGTSLAMFAQPEQPIREILVALGGPRGQERSQRGLWIGLVEELPVILRG